MAFVRSLVSWLIRLVVVAVLASICWVLVYKWLPVPLTWPMARDALAGRHVEREWVPLEAITPALPRAAIGAEDANFCTHNGFDFEALVAAAQANASGKALRGGSTISQQVAKNAFLWPGRSYVRKGLEAYFTVLIEALWGKRRIMEVYLNIAEMGPGIYGMEAAAQHYFHKHAADLSTRQAARLTAILPQPIERDPTALDKKVKRYARRIEKRVKVVREEGIDTCLKG
jgi:monofunctional biosynthetic peptidoglycan transglycosylase